MLSIHTHSTRTCCLSTHTPPGHAVYPHTLHKDVLSIHTHSRRMCCLSTHTPQGCAVYPHTLHQDVLSIHTHSTRTCCPSAHTPPGHAVYPHTIHKDVLSIHTHSTRRNQSPSVTAIDCMLGNSNDTNLDYYHILLHLQSRAEAVSQRKDKARRVVECSGPLGMEGGVISKGQLSSSSALRGVFGLQRWTPDRARLHGKGLVNAWSPAESDRWPWIQVNLLRRTRVTGLITQGARRLGSSEYVKSYKMGYSDNGTTWRMMTSMGDTQDMIFHGNSDSSSPMANAFFPPIEAQYIRIYPQVCRGHCTLRMELMGCELTGCSEPLGLKGGLMQDSQLTSSSVYRTLGMGLLAWTPNRARLDHRAKVNAWTAASNDRNQWIQVDLLVPTKITGVVTQGAKDFGRVQFVRSYKLAYSNDGMKWTTYQDEEQHKDKVFQGNIDNDTHRKNLIQPPIFGRFLRLIPWSWYGRVTVRMELLGCTEDD